MYTSLSFNGSRTKNKNKRLTSVTISFLFWRDETFRLGHDDNLFP